MAVKLTRIELCGFRGAKRKVGISLPSAASLLLYGENGSGKSTFTDGMEWFYGERVDHLASQEIGRKGRALPSSAMTRKLSHRRLPPGQGRRNAVSKATSSAAPMVSRPATRPIGWIACRATLVSMKELPHMATRASSSSQCRSGRRVAMVGSTASPKSQGSPRITGRSKSRQGQFQPAAILKSPFCEPM